MWFTTKQIADKVGVHTNTVRLYEKWGFISNVPRKNNGYRKFSEKHLDEMMFARAALPGPYPVKSKPIFDMIEAYVDEKYVIALECAQLYLKTVITEKEQSIETMKILDKWYKGKHADNHVIELNRREMAKKCDITIDTIRTWERNGICCVKKYKNNRIKYTNYDLEKIQITRLLRKSGFSIASIFQLFNNKDDSSLPSEFLTKIYKNTETICVTDEWISHLNNHIKRAENLIKLIEEKI